MKRILAEDGSRVSSGLFVFGLHLVRHFFLKGGVKKTGVLSSRPVKDDMSYTQTADATKDMKFYDRYKPIVRELLNALLPLKVRKHPAQGGKEAWRKNAQDFLS